MVLNAMGMLIVGVTVSILCLIVGYKLLIKKKPLDSGNTYTPFDYITGQKGKEFHEEEDLVQGDHHKKTENN